MLTPGQIVARETIHTRLLEMRATNVEQQRRLNELREAMARSDCPEVVGMIEAIGALSSRIGGSLDFCLDRFNDMRERPQQETRPCPIP